MSNDKTRDNLDTLKHDTHDSIDEAKNRLEAATEHAKRTVAGEKMPLGEQIASNVKEALHKTKADFDATKRDVRHDDTTSDKV